MKKICCEDLKFFLTEKKVRMKYDVVSKKIYILGGQYNKGKAVVFCPWCGTQFPKELKGEYQNLDSFNNYRGPIEGRVLSI